MNNKIQCTKGDKRKLSVVWNKRRAKDTYNNSYHTICIEKIIIKVV